MVSNKIGIIGGGVVGQAVKNFFKEAKIYDKFKVMDTVESVLLSEVIFICVPTPYTDKFDNSALEDAFANFKGAENKIVIIKSTSIPGTTDYFQEKYPNLMVLFNPEFLTERTASHDFLHPDKQLVGFTEKSKDKAQEILEMLPVAPYRKILPARAAELVKYAINSFYATKVIYGNMLYDVSQSMGVDYGDVKEAFVSDQRITDSHFDVLHGGYRGYGGKCLPKDLLALRDLCREKGVDGSLLDAVDTANRRLRGEQN